MPEPLACGRLGARCPAG